MSGSPCTSTWKPAVQSSGIRQQLSHVQSKIVHGGSIYTKGGGNHYRQFRLSETVYHTRCLLPTCSHETHLPVLQPVLQIPAKLCGTALATGVQLDRPELVNQASQGSDVLAFVLLFGKFSIQLVSSPFHVATMAASLLYLLFLPISFSFYPFLHVLPLFSSSHLSWTINKRRLL